MSHPVVGLALALAVLLGPGGGSAGGQQGQQGRLTLGSEVFVHGGGGGPPRLAREVVTLAYRGILGREPDEGGLENYVQHLSNADRQRGIVWLCSILLDSAEFKSSWPSAALPPASASLFGLRSAPRPAGRGGRAGDLAAQLHAGIEGCADEAPVTTTRRLLARGGSLVSSGRGKLGLIASRAALLIAWRTGARHTPLCLTPLCLAGAMLAALELTYGASHQERHCRLQARKRARRRGL